jgi:hypothetical protein
VGVTGHSLRGRLVLPATLFILTTLSLPWNRPRIPPPGRREGKKTSDRYCPYCHRKLTRPEKNVLYCRLDGEINEAYALKSLPQQGP